MSALTFDPTLPCAACLAVAAAVILGGCQPAQPAAKSAFPMVVGFYSRDHGMSKFDIANYVVSHVQEPLSRIDGVVNLNVFGGGWSEAAGPHS